MSASQTQPESAAPLTVQDLEAALRLLAAEAPKQASWRKLVFSLLDYISCGLMLLACPGGLLLVWFHRSLGVGLLILAGLAVVVFSIITLSRKGSVGQQARSLLDGSGLVEVASAGWKKRAHGLYAGVGCALVPGLVIILAGVIWLAYGLIANGTVNIGGLALIAVPILAFLVLLAIDEYGKYLYYSQVSRLRARFEAHLQQTGAEGAGEIPVTPEERELLSKVEIGQTERKIAQMTQRLAKKAGGYYSVTLVPDLLRFLEGLAQNDSIRGAIREVADSLQVDPHPPNAQPVPGSEEMWWIGRGDYRINYQVNRDKQRIDILQVLDASSGEVPHAA